MRFDLPDGGKEVLPYTYGRRVWTARNGSRRDVTGWHFKRPTTPVPLYGLDRLAADPRAPVLLVEGEKAADAGAALFRDHAVVASQGGSKAAGRADWSPLRGRDVSIWPDQDRAGAAYAGEAARMVWYAGAASVRVVDPPKDWPDGWDLADPLPEGTPTDTLVALLGAAPFGAGPFDAEPAHAVLLDVSPAHAALAQAAPFDAELADAAPLDAEPADVAPLDAEPADVAPLDAAAVGAVPPGAAPADTALANTAPSGTAPSGTAPADAAPADPVPVPELPDGFHFTERGLLFFPRPTEKNSEPPPVFVAAPFEVVGEANDGSGGSWGLVLRWRDRDGREHQWSVPKRLVHADGNAIAAELEDAGLRCGSDARAHQLLKQFIGGVRGGRRLRCVDRGGWHATEDGPVFILPTGESYGPAAIGVILQTESAGAGHGFTAAGSLPEWQREVGRYAEGNDRLALFLTAAFVGPLLDIASEQSGGIHLVGRSQCGKTTAAFVAGSVWGRGDRDAQVRQWRATANGLEGVASETSDAVLILDEMGQANANEVADTVYMLANGSGKARAGRGGEARRRKIWRSLFLSTGEVTLAGKMADVGKRAMAGVEVRLVNLPADAGAGMGVFQVLHGQPSAAALANHLRDASRTFYGTAARAYLSQLARDRADDPEGLRSWLAAAREEFIAAHVPPGADGQVRSVAARFALIGAAGELARGYGVLPWPEGEAMRAAGACFAVWLAERGGVGAAEEAQAVAQVRAFIEAHGASRFELAGSDEILAEPRTTNRAGFRRRKGDAWEYLILPETWRMEVCKGQDAKWVADVLTARGLLLRSNPRHRAALERVPGHSKDRLRVYVVSGAILEGDNGE